MLWKAECCSRRMTARAWQTGLSSPFPRYVTYSCSENHYRPLLDRFTTAQPERKSAWEVEPVSRRPVGERQVSQQRSWPVNRPRYSFAASPSTSTA